MMKKSVNVNCLALAIICLSFASATLARTIGVDIDTCAQQYSDRLLELEVPIGLSHMTYDDQRTNCTEFMNNYDQRFDEFDACGGFESKDIEKKASDILRMKRDFSADAFSRRIDAVKFCEDPKEPNGLLNKVGELVPNMCTGHILHAVNSIRMAQPKSIWALEGDQIRFKCETMREYLAEGYPPKCHESKVGDMLKLAKDRDTLWDMTDCLFGNYHEDMELTEVVKMSLGIVYPVLSEE